MYLKKIVRNLLGEKIVNGADTELSVRMIQHQLRFGVHILRKEDSLDNRTF